MRLSHIFPDPDLRAQVMRVERDANIRFNRLTPAQKKVVAQMLEGFSNKIIAYNLGISQRTVENHRAMIFRVLGVRTFADLMRVVVLAEMDIADWVL